MTTLATLPEDLKHLFERIDAAASDPALGLALSRWREARDGNVLPAPGDLDLPHGHGAYDRLFVLAQCEAGSGEWELVSSGAAARALLMPHGAWPRLDEFRNARLAARLRRLLRMASETGEPVVAGFSERAASGGCRRELLVAPLSTSGRAVDGALCGIGGDREGPSAA